MGKSASPNHSKKTPGKAHSLSAINSLYAPTVPGLEIQRAFTKILEPYNAISRQMEALTKALSYPTSILAQMQSSMNLYKELVPNIAYEFRISSAYTDFFRKHHAIFPAYLEGLAQWVRPLTASSDLLYRSLASLVSSTADISTTPELISAFVNDPSIDVAVHYQAMHALGFTEPQRDTSLENDFKEVLVERNANARETIQAIEPEWIVLLDGAEQSLASSNPDRVRHTITSLRELITQIIHRFAPDEVVRNQLQEERWYNNGTPTRRARLYCILTKKYGHDLMLDFIEKDIDATIALFELFHRGTHEIVSTIDPRELKFVLERARLLITHLIREI